MRGNVALGPIDSAARIATRRTDYLEGRLPILHPSHLGWDTDWSEIDLIVSVEAMGLPLLAAVGGATGKPTVVIRKRSYGMDGEVRVDVSTGYSKSTAYINDIRAGERLLIVDDVISTGGTLEPLLEALEGMGALLQNIIVAIEKGEGCARLARERPNWPISTLAKIDIIDGKVEIVE